MLAETRLEKPGFPPGTFLGCEAPALVPVRNRGQSNEGKATADPMQFLQGHWNFLISDVFETVRADDGLKGILREGQQQYRARVKTPGHLPISIVNNALCDVRTVRVDTQFDQGSHEKSHSAAHIQHRAAAAYACDVVGETVWIAEGVGPPLISPQPVLVVFGFVIQEI